MSWSCPSIRPLSGQLAAELQQAIDQKTKPLHALGRLEELALQLGLIQNSLSPSVNRPQHIIFAGDHGVTAEGVSPFPQEVTVQMVANFAQGGAAINVFCKRLGLPLEVVNAGVASPLPDSPGLINQPCGAGTANLVRQPALQSDQCLAALALGQQRVEYHLALGVNCFSFGEMGIGNTTSAAAIVAACLGLSGEEVAGAGTGLSAEGQLHKAHVINQALSRFSERTPLAILRQLGGFEIAAMTGAMLASAAADRCFIVDGLIAQAAALLAVRLAPACLERAVFAHAGREPGIAKVLRHLAVQPLLDLNLALGEGTGAVLAWPLLDCACGMLSDMSSFAEAGVSGG